MAVLGPPAGDTGDHDSGQIINIGDGGDPVMLQSIRAHGKASEKAPLAMTSIAPLSGESVEKISKCKRLTCGNKPDLRQQIRHDPVTFPVTGILDEQSCHKKGLRRESSATPHQSGGGWIAARGGHGAGA